MFLAKAGKYEACGIFTKGHFMLIAMVVVGIVVALKKTLHKTSEEIKNIIKNCTISMWIFEVVIIAFKIYTGGIKNLNNYVPLYYCSLLLYSGLLSSYTKGKLKRVGDVFLATGGIIGGVVYLIFPTTSLPKYPMWHIVSVHSFIFHGIMIYLGILINRTNYIELEKDDYKYYASLVGIACILAFIINSIFGCNLMFISQNFPGMPIEIIYNLSGKLFTPIMITIQLTLPFIIAYKVKKLIDKSKSNEMVEYDKVKEVL